MCIVRRDEGRKRLNGCEWLRRERCGCGVNGKEGQKWRVIESEEEEEGGEFVRKWVWKGGRAVMNGWSRRSKRGTTKEGEEKEIL